MKLSEIRKWEKNSNKNKTACHIYEHIILLTDNI